MTRWNRHGAITTGVCGSHNLGSDARVHLSPTPVRAQVEHPDDPARMHLLSVGLHRSAAMEGVYIGDGGLAGKGLYAARRFTEGEIVVPYRLRPITREEYRALPVTERLFVHSYGGERHLYPPPARYVNHSDTPNTYQDFDAHCDIALRPIEQGEFITTDATKETDRELNSFLGAYEAAVNAGDYRKADLLVDDQAVLWVGGPKAKRHLLDDLKERKATHGEGFPLSIRDVRWFIGTGRWEAVASYTIESRAEAGAPALLSPGHATDVLKLLEGNWQIIYRHLSPQ
jgi:hypothetical protein